MCVCVPGQCDPGFFGDCQARTCPSGRAWFHEPAVDEIAHDEFAECSNMGWVRVRVRVRARAALSPA